MPDHLFNVGQDVVSDIDSKRGKLSARAYLKQLLQTPIPPKPSTPIVSETKKVDEQLLKNIQDLEKEIAILSKDNLRLKKKLKRLTEDDKDE